MSDENIQKIIAQTFMNIADGLETGNFAKPVKIAVNGIGNEHGERNVLDGIMLARQKNIEITMVGSLSSDEINIKKAKTADESAKLLESLLNSGEIDCAVTMHYPFPIGVATVGRIITPGKGREMFIATTSGASNVERVSAMVINTIYGIIAAKACGISNPKIGILNIDGARQSESLLKRLAKNGYPITFAVSGRADGGPLMRGNDLLSGSCDVLVCDSLTGNILMKLMSAFTTGGNFESVGYGYGPGIGKEFNKLVMIISRASGAPVIAGSIRYAAQLIQDCCFDIAREELAAANKAGLSEILESSRGNTEKRSEIKCPIKEAVTYQIAGIEIMEIEDAQKALWAAGIYAESAMGCTGPVILVSDQLCQTAEGILRSAGWLH